MQRRSVRTKDGVTVSYQTGGEGRPTIMLGGWSQSSDLFAGQFADFTQRVRVFAVDNRGHGQSDKPATGYRIQRLAKDLFDLVEALNLADFDIVAHSLSASLTWAYLSLFGSERPPRRLILIDEPAALLARPAWTETEVAEAGAVVASLEALDAYEEAIRSADTIDTHLKLVRGMFTDAVGETALRALAEDNLKLPRMHAAELLADNVIQDWRRFIPTIRQPTLVFAGEGSIHPLASQRWLARTIPNARLEVVPAHEGGSHFLMYENPRLFNHAALGFLGG